MVFRRKLQTTQFAALAISVALVLGLSAVREAALADEKKEITVDTQVFVKNCSNSHHEVKVQSFNYDNPITPVSKPYTSKTLHSGTAGDFYCKAQKCKITFHSGSDTKEKDTSQSPWYVHVHDSHKMDISLDASICN